jgi:hypothetical protein
MLRMHHLVRAQNLYHLCFIIKHQLKDVRKPRAIAVVRTIAVTIPQCGAARMFT